MRKHTEEEITEFAKKICPEPCCDFVVNFLKFSDEEILFEVSRMYDGPSLDFKEMKAWSDFFETENIDKYDDISEQGCETCDYGSRYGYALRVWK